MQGKIGLSSGCAHCFGVSINCSETHCIEECACSTWSAEPCNSCMKKSCSSQFKSCSGIPSPAALHLAEDRADDFEYGLGLVAGRPEDTVSHDESLLAV